MRDADLVQYILKRHEDLAGIRAGFESDWRDIKDLVRPIAGGYNRVTNTFVTYKTGLMHDGTAPQALEELGATLHSYLTNPAERWFELQREGYQEQEVYDPEGASWLQTVTDIIYDCYSREDACLNMALFEAYLDVGAYGFAVINQEWDSDINGLSFSAKPVVDCYVAENSRGRIDTLNWARQWTIRNLRQEFGDLPPDLEKLAKKNEDKLVLVVHSVFPRTDRLLGNSLSTQKQFASVWICCDTKEVIRQSGYDSFPYHVPRWAKLAGEVYGRGPAMKCLPDIKMLNSMERTLLKAGQKMVDPPLQVTDEGFLLPIKTEPGSLIYREVGTEPAEPLDFKINLPWGLEQANQKRDFIKACFYSEWIKMQKENKEMTAYEVADRREEKLRLMAPMLSRLTSELHGPMIQRSFALLRAHGRIPPAPESMMGQFLKIGYQSPASRAQTGVKALSMGRYIQELLPVAQVSPEVLDIVDWDSYARELAKARGTPLSILRSDEEIQQIRQSRQAQQALAQAAAVAEPASKALKNISDAQAKGGLDKLMPI